MHDVMKITRGPGEPHPDDEHAWKCWWVKRMFDPEEPLTTGALKWIHDCWLNTKALWHTLSESEVGGGGAEHLETPTAEAADNRQLNEPGSDK